MSDLRTAAQQALEALEDVDGPITALLGSLLGSPDADAPGAKVRTAITALRAALAQQAEPLNLRDPAVQKRLATQWGYVPAAQAEPVEPVDVGLLEYRGNSVAFIHQKMTAYRTGIDAAWDAFRANGLHSDGKTSLADMIAKHTAPPQRKLVPLTEAEIEHIGITHQSLRQVARAVERAVWEKNNG